MRPPHYFDFVAAQFSITIVVLRSAWSSGWTRRTIWSVVPPGGNGTMNRIGRKELTMKLESGCVADSRRAF